MEHCYRAWGGGVVLPAAAWICQISYKNGYTELLVLPFQNLAFGSSSNLSLLYRHYFGRCSSEQAELVPFPILVEQSTH